MYFSHSFILNSMILTQTLIVKFFQVLNIHKNACFYTFLVQKKQASLSANLPFRLPISTPQQIHTLPNFGYTAPAAHKAVLP